MAMAITKIRKLLAALERIREFARSPPPTSHTYEHALALVAAMAEGAIEEEAETPTT